MNEVFLTFLIDALLRKLCMKMLKFIWADSCTTNWYFFFVMTWGNICYVTRFSFFANKISIDPLSLS